MAPNNLYLSRYAHQKTLFESQPASSLSLIVVIPCLNETALISSLEALKKCTKTKKPVEIIVIINDSEESHESIKHQNLLTYRQAINWATSNSSTDRKVLIHYESSMPKKSAGVGLARKIGMDEAVRRFERINNSKGIIACFDADSQCSENYLSAIEQHASSSVNFTGASIFFEHPYAGSLSDLNYQGIINYELFLRHYINALRWCNFPYAYHTIGSSMAVRSDSYQSQGGMNKRQAGEDFYFMQKIIELGNFEEINSTTVYPSARASDRVPFGTGKAINDWLSANQQTIKAYHPSTFESLKTFLDDVFHFYDWGFDSILTKRKNWPANLNAYLETEDFINQLKTIFKNGHRNRSVFYKRFFSWFNAFKVLKYVHYSRDHYFANIDLMDGIKWLGEVSNMNSLQLNSETEWLDHIRKIDRKGRWQGGISRYCVEKS